MDTVELWNGRLGRKTHAANSFMSRANLWSSLLDIPIKDVLQS